MTSEIHCAVKEPDDLNASYETAIAENPANCTTPASARMMWAKKNHTKFWAPGRTLRIALLGGSQEFKDAVKAALGNWTPHINLNFEFVEGDNGDIRIQSEQTMYWSYIGTDALLHATGPTMNLPPHLFHARYFAANVMHEFGHMLGAEHEQNHPQASIPWDKDAFFGDHDVTEHPDADVDTYREIYTRKRLNEWYLNRLDPSETHHSPYDPKSIMHYEIKQRWTQGDFRIFLNFDLSEHDKAFMAKAYPFDTSSDA